MCLRLKTHCNKRGENTRDTKVQMINKLQKIENGPLFARVTDIESKILPLPQGLPL